MAKTLFYLTLFAVTVLAFIPTYASLPDAVSVSDVLNHFAAFSVLFFLHLRAYPAEAPQHRILLLIAYGVFIEAVQYFLPARSASAGDIAVDAAAVLFSAAIQRLLPRFVVKTV